MRKPLLLLATAAATLAFASPALAQTNVGPLAGPNGNVSFGTGWAAGAPAGPGLLTWNPVGALTTPNLTGQLTLRDQPANASADIQMEFFDGVHSSLGSQFSPAEPGVPGARVSYPVSLGSFQSISNHVHLYLRRNGTVIDTAICNLGAAAC
jgi:hypothetical protein